MPAKKTAQKKTQPVKTSDTKTSNKRSIVLDGATTKPVNLNKSVSKSGKKSSVVRNESFGKSVTANYFQSNSLGGSSGGDISFLAPDYYHPELQPDQLLLPKSRRERNLWCRHFYENDPILAQAVDFHTEAPLSSIRLAMPECSDHKRAKMIFRFYEDMVERLELFDTLLAISHEYWLFGNVFPFSEWDDDTNTWSSVIILDPNDVIVRKYPFSKISDIELQIPPDITNIINNPDPRYADILSSIPNEILEFVRSGKNLPLDTDPYAGSHISHIHRKKSPYRQLGTSIVERVFKPLVYKDRLQNAQQAIADRNMSPKHVVTAPDVGEEVIDNLQEMVEFAMSDPDFAVIANYEVNWNLVGANERLLQIQSDLEYIDKQVMTGLGLMESLLTGESSYGGNLTLLGIINERYLLYRETLINWVENNLFKPVAFKNGFWEKDEFGNRKLIYPKLKFNRLNLRDSNDMFSNLFNLYSKGSLDIDTILEFYHIDSVEVKNRLERDMFTVKDPTFNDLIRSIYSELGRAIAGSTDLTERVSSYMNLRVKAEPEEEDSSPF